MKMQRVLLVAFVLAGPVMFAQKHRDPLTQPEIGKIRDTSWEPRLRLPLYVEFARARMVKLEEIRSDPKTANRAKQTHDLLDDFQLLYDELNDNIDTYVDRHDDIRKPLKLVIEADGEFQAKLRGLKDAADVPAAEAQQYEFVLNNALETVDSSAEDHKKLLQDQEEQAKHKKLNKNPSAGTGVAPE
jgi:type II secretory pathway component GspD/PulD (secretin)